MGCHHILLHSTLKSEKNTEISRKWEKLEYPDGVSNKSIKKIVNTTFSNSQSVGFENWGKLKKWKQSRRWEN